MLYLSDCILRSCKVFADCAIMILWNSLLFTENQKFPIFVTECQLKVILKACIT